MAFCLFVLPVQSWWLTESDDTIFLINSEMIRYKIILPEFLPEFGILGIDSGNSY